MIMTLNLEAYIGDQGSGKTQRLTLRLYEQYLSGVHVIANYHLNFPFTLMPFSRMAELPPNLENIAIGMDELGVGADSYDFLQSQPRGLAKIISQLRKRNAWVGFTVQRYSMIVRRIRIQTGRFHLMQDLDSYRIPKPPLKHRDICQAKFSVTTLDEQFNVIEVIPAFMGKRWQHLYDDREVIFE